MLDYNLYKKKRSLKQINRIKRDTNKRFLHLLTFYSDSRLFKENKKNLGGIFDILDGLIYHYKRHCALEKRAQMGKAYGAATHEINAYINRLGQIYYLFTSTWFKVYISDRMLAKKIPTLLSLIPIRMKVTAHRQQDRPWGDDCKSLGWNEFGLRPVLSGLSYQVGVIDLSSCKICYSFPTQQRETNLLNSQQGPVTGVEFFGDSNNVIQFHITDLHPIIIEEIFELIEHALQHQ